VLVVAPVDDGGFAGYDGRVDLGGILPEGWVDGGQDRSALCEEIFGGFVGGEDFGGAVVEEG